MPEPAFMFLICSRHLATISPCPTMNPWAPTRDDLRQALAYGLRFDEYGKPHRTPTADFD